jgi:hypothetical protein
MSVDLAIDLYCGLGGWTEGLLAEGYRVVGFDIERHDYGTGGYPGQLVIQDVLTLHGSQLKDAALIVASPPCQAYSYRAMPWSRAKALPPPDNTLFEACFRIQREASEAAGRHIPLIVENVKGAQKWVGRARWHFGSYYLWGDVPALMPITFHTKLPKDISDAIRNGQSPPRWTNRAEDGHLKLPGNNSARRWEDRPIQRLADATKVPGISFSGYGKPGYRPVGFNVTAAQRYREARANGAMSRFASKSDSRKAASAAIAKIPFPLAQHIARVFRTEQAA